jgi:hypothetical protein
MGSTHDPFNSQPPQLNTSLPSRTHGNSSADPNIPQSPTTITTTTAVTDRLAVLTNDDDMDTEDEDMSDTGTKSPVRHRKNGSCCLTMQSSQNSHHNEPNDINSVTLDDETEPSDLPTTPKRYLADGMLPTAPLSYRPGVLELTTLDTRTPLSSSLSHDTAASTQPDRNLRPFTAFEENAKREILPILATDAYTHESILVVCDPARSHVADVIKEHLYASPMPQGHVITFPRPSLLYPTGAELRTQFSQSFSKIVCIGPTNPKQVINDSTWLPSWQGSLKKGGVLVLELDWIRGSKTWRDVALQYEQMLHPLGLYLHAMNGCSKTLGESRVEMRELHSKYANLSSRLSTADPHMYAKLCNWLDSEAKVAKRKGIQRSLYGSFCL